MGKRNRESKLVHISNIHEDMKLIDGSSTDYITPSGQVYKLYHDDMYYPKKAIQNNVNKYMYIGITFSDGVNRSRRQHVLMAKAFIPNPDPEHLKYVGHKDDIKWHNTLDNLYWTDTQENTQSAINHNLLIQPKAEQNENSIFIKVIDKNTNQIVGVYGSISECARCIENMSKTSICKMIQKENYKPRYKKYIYQVASEKEFEINMHLRSKHLIENIVDKSPKVFYLINDYLKYKEKFDNQTQAAKVCGISQAILSHMINDGSIINGWKCEYIETINYKDASSYENLMKTINQIIIQNIKTKEIKIYDSAISLKNDFGLNGHDIKQYLYNNHILMNEWKIISIESKDSDSYSEKVVN